MNDIAIRAEHLGKQYRIGKKRRAGYSTFREALLTSLSMPVRWLRGELEQSEFFWALEDISFEIKQGEAVGIIGRNGAGKSTLLKVLSRITKPTLGRVDLYGRVASLLEVGTGFHPELTGRDNVYLNGAILGMTRREIDRKFDEIVDFAGVSKFLDTPVKHYSSGMFVRLAFAVSAHLEPEILVVDEVLAVGDAEFQKKCLGKMDDVARSGRTVLFVSHNMGAISNLCHRAILLDNGCLIQDGDVPSVIAKYQASASQMGSVQFELVDSEAYFTKASVLNSSFEPSTDVVVTEKFYVELEYVVTETLRNVDVAFILFDHNGAKVFDCSIADTGHSYHRVHDPGKFTARIHIPAEFLTPGTYTISPVIHEYRRKMYDIKNHAVQFTILETGSVRSRMMGANLGVVFAKFPWDIHKA